MNIKAGIGQIQGRLHAGDTATHYHHRTVNFRGHTVLLNFILKVGEKIESKLHSLMNSWTTTKKTFYSQDVKFVNQNLTQIHKISVKFIS